MLHSRTGEVEFIGRHPMEAAFMSEELQPQQYEMLLKDEDATPSKVDQLRGRSGTGFVKM